MVNIIQIKVRIDDSFTPPKGHLYFKRFSYQPTIIPNGERIPKYSKGNNRKGDPEKVLFAN